MSWACRTDEEIARWREESMARTRKLYDQLEIEAQIMQEIAREQARRKNLAKSL